MKDILIILCMLSVLLSCDSMVDDKAKALQNNPLLLLLRPGGVNEETEHLISGRVADGTRGVAGVTIAVTGGGNVSLSCVTDEGGAYSINLPASGAYTVKPSINGFTMDPLSRVLDVQGRVRDVDFTARADHPEQIYDYLISGAVTSGGAGLAGISITVTGGDGGPLTVVTDVNGRYYAGLSSPGTYTVTPAGGAYHIYPSSKTLSVQGVAADIDFLAGTPLWMHRYGISSFDEVAYSACRTSDGGYLVAGYGFSDVSGSPSIDGRIVKMDAGGNVIWDKYYGGRGEEAIHSIVEITGNNYITAGYTTSRGHGGKDAWVIMIDTDGNQVAGWDHAFGGAYDDWANSIVQGSSGEFVFTGITTTDLNKENAYAVRINASGEVGFERSYGGNNNDGGNAIINADTGVYLIAGYNRSQGVGDMDSWAFMIDNSGLILEGRVYYSGKAGDDMFKTAIHDGNGGYMMGGYSTHGVPLKKHFCMVKMRPDLSSEWEKENLSGDNEGGSINSICIMDGGYLAVGTISITCGNPRLIKVDAAGNMINQETYSNPQESGANWIIPGYDGTYLIAGYFKDAETYRNDFLAINVNVHGKYR